MGQCLLQKIPDKNERNVFGDIDPGIGVFKKLEKKGLVFFTEEEPFEIRPGIWFTWTNEVCLVTN